MTEQNTEPAADGTSGAETGAENAVEPSEDTTVDDDTGRVFEDAFAPPWAPDDGAPGPEDYASAIRTMGLEDNDSEDPAQSDTEDDTEAPSANSEAARYRHRLRDAKAELAATQDRLDALRGRVDILHRAEAERVAAGSLIEPADLWRDGATVADIRDPHGDVDENAVRKLAAAVIKAHPHAARASRSVWGRAGSGASAPPAENEAPAFAQAFAPRRKG